MIYGSIAYGLFHFVFLITISDFPPYGAVLLIQKNNYGMYLANVIDQDQGLHYGPLKKMAALNVSVARIGHRGIQFQKKLCVRSSLMQKAKVCPQWKMDEPEGSQISATGSISSPIPVF